MKEYIENNTLAPLVLVWHGNIIMNREITVHANITPIDKFLFFYAGIETYSAGRIIPRFLGISNATVSINGTFDIRGLNPDALNYGPEHPAIITSGIEGRTVYAEITVTPATPLYKYFLIRETGCSEINITILIP